MPWLPATHIPWPLLPTELVRGVSTLSAGPSAGSHNHGNYWLALWSAGALLGLIRLARAYVGLSRRCRPLPDDLVDATRELLAVRDRSRLRLHDAGPAVLWAPRSLILLPADFLQRFDASQRAMVLAHESTHLRRGDALWTLLAELACAALWFHPLVWLALPRFRLDQELACDESMLRQGPHDAGSYARTLFSSAAAVPAAALIPWLAEPQLKERLMMIRRDRTTKARRIAGYLGTAAFIGSLCLAAQAAPLATPPGPKATQNLEADARMQPRYPKASIANKEQGTVVLKVRVNPDGTVKAVDYDPKASTTTSANLIAAASDAAMQWRFNPALKQGQPVERYARVPVKFSLDELPGTISKSNAEKKASEYAKRH